MVLLPAKGTVHKQGAKRPKDGKKSKYRTFSLFFGISEWRRCARQRQRDPPEAPLGDLPLMHKFMLQRAVFNVFLGGVAALSTWTGLPRPPLVSVTVAN